ncbi:MAG: sigma 54-interacting transcriptional regulator [Blastocatellales bacterium]
MKIGVVTIDGELKRLLVAEIRASVHEAVVCDDLPQALAEEAQLVFAEWAPGERLPVLLAGMRAAAERAEPIPVIVLAPAGAAAVLSRAREAGAADVLFIPPDPEEIRAEIADAGKFSVEETFAYSEQYRELRRRHLVGEDRAFLRCLGDLRRAAQSEANVLVLGETGTGKEMFTQAIHALSSRSGNKYLPVNCANFPGPLLEAELFGHAKGAFTGADKERTGRFEDVEGGTLLLDEIGDIEMPFQTKLLRVIEQRTFQRLGEGRDRRFHARLVCATSVDLEQAVAANKFRPDLLGRIDQFRIFLPSLRQRRSDIPLLTRHFLQKHAKGRLVQLSKTAQEMLEAYDFPMNVRQLENVIIGALMRSDPDDLILPKHLPREITNSKAESKAPADHTITIPSSLSYKVARDYALRVVDHIYLTDLLSKHGNKQSRVAEELGIDRKTLRDRLNQAVVKQAETAEE